MKVKIEAIKGVEGHCLSISNLRVAGPKPRGGGTVVLSWEVDVKAIREVGIDLAKSVRKHAGELTRIELIRLLTSVCHDYVADITKSMLRLERHDDPDKPADWGMIHVLRHGRPMCGFTRAVPGFWPEGHGWVHQPYASHMADCQGCLDALAGLNPKTAEVRTVGDLIARLKMEDPTMPVVAKAPQTKPPQTKPLWAEALAVDVERHEDTGHEWGATVVIGGVPVAPGDW